MNEQIYLSLVWTDVVLKIMAAVLLLGGSREAIMLFILIRRHLRRPNGSPTDYVTNETLDSRIKRLKGELFGWQIKRASEAEETVERWYVEADRHYKDIKEAIRESKSETKELGDKIEKLRDDVGNLMMKS
jgi:hypothetical protein